MVVLVMSLTEIPLFIRLAVIGEENTTLYKYLSRFLFKTCAFKSIFTCLLPRTRTRWGRGAGWGWGGLRASMSLRAVLAGPLEVLVGSPMPDRSKVGGQTKSKPSVLQAWGFCTGLTTLSCKNSSLRKQQRVIYMNYLCRTSLRSEC